MWRMFTTSSSYHYLNKLDILVSDNNNKSVHRSIQMKPADVTVFNAQDARRTLYGKQLHPKSINSTWVINSRSVSTRKSLRKDTCLLGPKKPVQLHRNPSVYHEIHRCIARRRQTVTSFKEHFMKPSYRQ